MKLFSNLLVGATFVVALIRMNMFQRRPQRPLPVFGQSRQRYKWLIALFFLLYPVLSFTESYQEILVNHRMAERLNLRAGDIVEIAPTGDMKRLRKYKIAAIYNEPADPALVPLKRNFIKMHLSDLEELSGKKDELDLISIQITRNTDASTLAARLNADAIGFTAYSAQELANRSSTTFVVVSKFHEAIALIAMTAGAVFIFALMVMRVEDKEKTLRSSPSQEFPNKRF